MNKRRSNVQMNKERKKLKKRKRKQYNEMKKND